MCVRGEGKLQYPAPLSIKTWSLLPNSSNSDWPWELLWPAESSQQPLHVCSKPGPQRLLHDVPYFLGRLPLHLNKLCSAWERMIKHVEKGSRSSGYHWPAPKHMNKPSGDARSTVQFSSTAQLFCRLRSSNKGMLLQITNFGSGLSGSRS